MTDEDLFERIYGTDDRCPQRAGDLGHEPDWDQLSVEHDGGEVYIDVACRHCGRSGCLGTMSTLAKDISW